MLLLTRLHELSFDLVPCPALAWIASSRLHSTIEFTLLSFRQLKRFILFSNRVQISSTKRIRSEMLRFLACSVNSIEMVRDYSKPTLTQQVEEVGVTAVLSPTSGG